MDSFIQNPYFHAWEEGDERFVAPNQIDLNNEHTPLNESFSFPPLFQVGSGHTKMVTSVIIKRCHKL